MAKAGERFWENAGPEQSSAALLVTLGMVLIIGTALAFEHIGGYAPCALCLEQRNPYYWGLPIVAVGMCAGYLNWPPCIVRGTLVIGLLCLLATAMMGFYHAGAEWKFWPGPESCGAGLAATSSDAGSLLGSLSNAKPPSCVDAAGRFLGLSFAGWNFIVAMLLAIIAARGAFGKTG